MEENNLDIRYILGSNLKRIRKELKLSQSEFGAIIGVKQNTISFYESGNSFPETSTIENIIKKFDINFGDLFDNIKHSDKLTANEPVQKYKKLENSIINDETDILTYLTQLEENSIIPTEILIRLKSLIVKVYKERSEDKEDLLVQYRKYQQLLEKIADKNDL